MQRKFEKPKLQQNGKEDTAKRLISLLMNIYYHITFSQLELGGILICRTLCPPAEKMQENAHALAYIVNYVHVECQ